MFISVVYCNAVKISSLYDVIFRSCDGIQIFAWELSLVALMYMTEFMVYHAAIMNDCFVPEGHVPVQASPTADCCAAGDHVLHTHELTEPLPYPTSSQQRLAE